MNQYAPPAAAREQKPSIQLFTPAARIVTGNLQKPNPLDMYGRPRPQPQYFFGVAFPKNHPDCGPMFQAMHNFARQQYAHFPDVVRRIDMLWTHGPKNIGFAFKFEDGDVPHPQKGIREGYAGCWVMKFTTTFPIRTCDVHENNIPPEQVLTGYLVDVAFRVVANGKTDHTAGLFVNPVFVRLLSAAQPIVGGPQASQVFQGRAAPTHELSNFQAAMQPRQGVPGMGGGQQYQQPAPAPQQFHQPQTGYQQPAPAPQYQPAGPNSGYAPTHAPAMPMHQAGGPVGNGYPIPAPAMQPGQSAQMNSGTSFASAPGAVPGGQSSMPGGQGTGNPQPAPSLPGAPGMQQPAPTHAAPSSPPVETAPAYPSDAGNGHPAVNGPAVPAGASAAPVHSTGAQPGSQTASPSEYQPHPQFVHGAQGT